ncbi:RNA polymerase sigma factor [Siminovitchia sp. 179-K 8D1 HS]|uniref:RNA polymerase sigma factor n=1 Tax=Siminovitchia sp. 179-K 8D1 HS TaxID=3142385 RepID=UPI00399EFA92
MGLLKALVKKAKKGDGEAFVSLVKQYEDVLYRTASRMLNNEEDVADVMQDTIISAYEKLHTLKNCPKCIYMRPKQKCRLSAALVVT